MARRALPKTLSPQQQDEANRIFQSLKLAAESDLRDLASQLATTTDETIFGPNEFLLRDVVPRVAAKALESTLEGRKKARPANVTSGRKP